MNCFLLSLCIPWVKWQCSPKSSHFYCKTHKMWWNTMPPHYSAIYRRIQALCRECKQHTAESNVGNLNFSWMIIAEQNASKIHWIVILGCKWLCWTIGKYDTRENNCNSTFYMWFFSHVMCRKNNAITQENAEGRTNRLNVKDPLAKSVLSCPWWKRLIWFELYMILFCIWMRWVWSFPPNQIRFISGELAQLIWDR